MNSYRKSTDSNLGCRTEFRLTMFSRGYIVVVVVSLDIVECTMIQCDVREMSYVGHGGQLGSSRYLLPAHK